jgi:hypothetical protein
VTSIAQNAFNHCESLANVVIPDSVITIDFEAFRYCTSLTSILLGNSVTIIDMDAFSGCTLLQSVVIPNSVIIIDMAAFNSCTLLKSVYYKGTAEEWAQISISGKNECLMNANIYYYSETEASGCWRYVDGVPTVW